MVVITGKRGYCIKERKRKGRGERPKGSHKGWVILCGKKSKRVGEFPIGRVIKRGGKGWGERGEGFVLLEGSVFISSGK